jgi:hypothetical protein
MTSRLVLLNHFGKGNIVDDPIRSTVSQARNSSFASPIRPPAFDRPGPILLQMSLLLQPQRSLQICCLAAGVGMAAATGQPSFRHPSPKPPTDRMAFGFSRKLRERLRA